MGTEATIPGYIHFVAFMDRFATTILLKCSKSFSILLKEHFQINIILCLWLQQRKYEKFNFCK